MYPVITGTVTPPKKSCSIMQSETRPTLTERIDTNAKPAAITRNVKNTSGVFLPW